MGPHGICIGATGSGKSEMLRTLVPGARAVAPARGPEHGARRLQGRRGVRAVRGPAARRRASSTTWPTTRSSTERARASIDGEVRAPPAAAARRRHSPSITHYRELRRERPDLAPLPHLLVVIDEFGELLTARAGVRRPAAHDRADRALDRRAPAAVQPAHRGRQAARPRHLPVVPDRAAHLLARRSPSVVLDTPDAFHLPAVPGYGYLKVDTTVYRRFRAGYVSGPGRRRRDLGPRAATDRRRPSAAARPATTASGAGQRGRRAGSSAASRSWPGRRSAGRWSTSASTGCGGGAGARSRRCGCPRCPSGSALLGARARRRATWQRCVAASRWSCRRPARRPGPPAAGALGARPDARGRSRRRVIGAPQTGAQHRSCARSPPRSPSPAHPAQVSRLRDGPHRWRAAPHRGLPARRRRRDPVPAGTSCVRLLEELRGDARAARGGVPRPRASTRWRCCATEHAAGRIPELVSADVVLLVDGVGAAAQRLRGARGPARRRCCSAAAASASTWSLAMTRWNDLRMAQQPLIGTRSSCGSTTRPTRSIDRKLNAHAHVPASRAALLTDDKLFAQVALPVLERRRRTTDARWAPALEALARSVRRGVGRARPRRADPAAARRPVDPSDLPDAFDEPDAAPLRPASGHHGAGAARPRNRRPAPARARRPRAAAARPCCAPSSRP